MTIFFSGTNGTSHREVLHLSFFSKEDGKDAIVQSCKDLHRERKLLENNSSKSLHHSINQISESLVDKKVKALVNSEFSIDEEESERGLKTDPDLLIVFGKVMSTAGFLPWHIRLTEIQYD
jgi:undecaprenyl pyrophosphate synthase